MTGRGLVRQHVALGLAAIGLLDIVIAVTGVIAVAGRDGFDPVQSFLIPNLPAGAAFAVCGLVIVHHRERQPIGWLFLVGGLGNLTAAAVVPWQYYAVAVHWPTAVTQLLISIYSAAWPTGSFLAYPIALLLFPDGRLLSPRWRGVVVVQTLAWVSLLLDGALDLHPDGPPKGQHGLTADARLHDALRPVWTLAGVLQVSAAIAVIAGIAVRYRRGDEVVRRQMLWLLLAAAIALLSLSVFFPGWVSPLILLTFLLIPISVGIAIVRYDLLDIRVVVSRAVVYAVLTGAVLGLYAALVGLVDLTFGHRPIGGPAVAAIVVALVFNPARLWLQTRVDRLLYGHRNDPIRAVAAVGKQLSGGGAGLAVVLDALRAALQLPYAAIRAAQIQVESGHPTAETETVPLRYSEELLGELVVGHRSGQHRLTPADRSVLSVVAAPIAVALHATRLSHDLQESQKRIVTAREEERRRIRNDLHDGLGPTLTGVAFTIDGIGNVLADDPALAQSALARLRAEVTTAIDDIRRLVDGLRPPALDQLGLVGALRAQAVRVGRNRLGEAVTIEIHTMTDLPALPAAVEVAAYRIVAEALTNIARHSDATHVTIDVVAGQDLLVTVNDDGANTCAWRPGVGLTSMAERAGELGGTCTGEATADGGRVRVCLPLVDAPRAGVDRELDDRLVTIRTSTE